MGRKALILHRKCTLPGGRHRNTTMGMILVIGGSGFIGSAVVRRLVRRGERIAVTTTRPARARALFEGLGVEVRAADVRDEASLARAMAGVERVVISVQFPGFPVENPARGRTFRAIDTEGTRRAVAAASQAGVERVVYVSGVNVGPDARQHWFRAKWASEEAVRAGTASWVIVRPTWVYGPGDKAFSLIARSLRLAPVMPVPGDGQQRLQPVYVGDVAEAVVAALLRAEAAGGTFEIGGPDVVTFDDVVRAPGEALGRRPVLVHVPMEPLRALAALAALLPGPPLTPDALEFATMEALADNTALIERLGIRPLSLREGLATYLG